MDCPRCGTQLTRISLNGDLQSVYCERCRFADVESDHTSASDGGETWEDALRRFRTANATESDDSDADADPDTEPADTDGTETGPDSEPSADADGVPEGSNDTDGTEASDPESDHPDDEAEAEEA